MKKKYIKSLQLNFPELSDGKSYYFSVPLSTYIEKADVIGFTDEYNVGETVLPPSSSGRFSKFNIEGKYIKNKSRGKEFHRYPVKWTRQQYNGRNQMEEVTDVVYRKIERWCRDFIEAPEIHLSIISDSNNTKYIVTELQQYIESNHENMLHSVNLMLEIFGECEIMDINFDLIIPQSYIYLNFEILPAGEHPFSQQNLEYLQRNPKLSSTQKCYIEERGKFLNQFQSSTIYRGKNGLSGYYILEFHDRNLLIVENLYYGNATYIFENSYNELDFEHLTKKEVLNNNMQKDRIIHDENWQNKILSHLS